MLFSNNEYGSRSHVVFDDEHSLTTEDPPNLLRKSVQKATLAAMILFSIGYMISEPNLDGFNLEEALEYINNDSLDSIPVHLAGFIASFIANVPLLTAIIYCWHHASDHDEGHSHSRLQSIIEFIAIGSPFGMMGTAAYFDTMNEFFDIEGLSLYQKVLAYSGSVLSGLITAFGAYKLHGFHVHDAMEEHGGGIKGFLTGIYTTFVKNVWAAKDNKEKMYQKVWAIFDDIWKKYGIVAVHGFLGSFAANVFLEQTQLANRIPAVDLGLKIFLPLAVMLYEGNTEARSLDAYTRKNNYDISYATYSKFLVTFSGMLHTLPAVTALALLIGNFHEGPADGKVYNAGIYAMAAVLLGYPSVYGFVATTIPGFDKAARNVSDKLEDWGCCRRPRRYTVIGGEQESAGKRLLNWLSCGFFKSTSKKKDDAPEIFNEEQSRLWLK